MFIEKLVNDIYDDEYLIELYEKACKNFTRNIFKFKYERLTNKELKDILRFADILSNSSNISARNKSYRIISLLKDEFCNNNVYKVYSNAILKRLCNFPSLKNSEDIKLPMDREIDYVLEKVKHEIPIGKGHFTPVQHNIYGMMKDSNFFSFSGPTSMGKSFLIREFILDIAINNKKIKGTCIIVPTKALIKQYVIDITKDFEKHNVTDMNIIATPNILEFVSFKENRFIFILTPERLMNLLSSKHPYYLDYIIIDEAHKVFEKNERALTYYTSIDYCMSKFKHIKVIVSSPLIQNPDIYGSMYFKNEVKTFKTMESPVTQNLFYIDCINDKISFYDEDIYNFNIREIKYLKNLNQIISTVGGKSNIIYINSYDKVISRALEYSKFLTNKNTDLLDEEDKEEINKLCELIKMNIHPEYYLIECLKQGVGFHFGKLPVVIREQVERLFKKGIIKYLFCTNTLLEGVNMPAKNIFILSDKIGKSPISKIDFWNLAGRAGRLGHEFYGNIFCVKEDETSWANVELFKEKDKIKVENRLNECLKDKRITIRKIINNNEIRPNNGTEKKYINYVANIVRIDSLNNNETSLIKNASNIDSKIIELCSNIANAVDLDILNSSKLIDINIQNEVFNNIFIEEMPNEVNYNNCLKILQKMHDLYKWDIKEKNLKKEKSMRYYAWIMTKWINDTPLSQIILKSIQYNHENNRNLWYRGENLGVFDINNKDHVNMVINTIIDDIEKVLKYDLEKYFNHYYMLIASKFGDDKVGLNWASYLEFGTRNNKNIILQNIGFSRYTSNILLTRYRKYLKFDLDGALEIKKEILDTDIVENIAIYNEISAWLSYR
ncbi:DEAD/DEAH box helicase [Paraclostridium bifermentans]|uniref:DEAD/DEAH box helicase n=1 Tax=Paraclostridium bifermentans TaxID=1490 RepID=A0AA44IG82_PARBF|nr:DEAD/DEAH box helicase [Paraclostridium bifermentans]MBN8047278.1 DEAD/DEAH box helicase [Paraclostridium bifermentans]NME08650.1 DEAD/DEAH box helicase [Paraclostridium bifermentans]